MGKETVGLKLDSEIAQRFKDVQKEHGSAQEFVEILLNNHLEKQIETDIDSPVHKEKVRVKKALADVERVVSGFLEIAASDKAQAVDKAQEKVITAQDEVTELKGASTVQKETIAGLEKQVVEQEKTIAGLEESAESIQALKDAWEIEKGNLTTRLAELDGEAKEARALKTKVSDLKELMSKSVGNIALLKQQQENDQAVITDLKDRLAKSVDDMKTGTSGMKLEHKETMVALESKHEKAVSELKKDIEQARADLVIAKEDVTVEKLACAEKMTKIKTASAGEHGRLNEVISTLEKKLADKKKK